MANLSVHNITHWAADSINECGEKSFSDPVEVKAFWIDETKEYTSQEMIQFMSNARILSSVKLFSEGDRVQFSDLANSNKDNSFIVRSTKFIENTRQTKQLYQAILSK